MIEFETEIKIEFLNEAKELLSRTEECFLTLEKNPSDIENLNHIFRLAHNLKGSSGAVGFIELADFTHKFESLLLALKEARLAVTGCIVDLLLRTNDYLVRTIEVLKEDIGASYANAELADELIQALEGKLDSISKDDSQLTTSNEESLSRELARYTRQSLELSTISHANETIHGSGLAKTKDENIRVNVSRIEKLLNNVGELSILQSVMVQQGKSIGSQMSQLMRDTLSSMTKIIRDTQNISMGLRMLPVKQTFQKMDRIVRDVSKTLGKNVELHLSGEETEIDKTVLEQLADPLVHIVRNAVDHGLEDSETRQSIGKPAVGHVNLSAYHRSGQIVIEIKDDGRGLDSDVLISKAKSKGLLPPEAQLTPEQAYQLIFQPGFSTKDHVTDVSGRGVGMDVVKTNIAALQGRIEIETTLGLGTCFRIFLPLTLAVIDSVVVRLEDQRFVIPLSQVSEFFRPQESEITYVFDRSELLTLRDETIPTFRLSSLLGHLSDIKEKPARNLTALIVRDGAGESIAILVDRVVAQQQVVIKPLGPEMKGRLGVMGIVILGDGKPALILDLLEMKKSVIKNDELKSKSKHFMNREAV